jgi:hypothetical protein
MLRPFLGIWLFAAAASLQCASLTNTVAVSCSVSGVGSSTTNPCSLQGTVLDPLGRPVPAYAQSSVSTSVDYGLITASVSNRADNGFAMANVTTGFLDRLNIFGTGSGSLQLNMFLPGCVVCGASVSNVIGVGANTQTVAVAGQMSRTLTFPIIFGENVDFRGELRIRANASDEDDATTGSFIFRVDGIRVFDASGAQLQNFLYATESGRSYTVQSGQLVPEPKTVWLVLCAVIAFIGIRNFRIFKAGICE